TQRDLGFYVGVKVTDMARHRKRRDPNRQEPNAPRTPPPNSGDDSLDDEELRRLSEALGEDFEVVGPEDDVWDVPIETITPSISLDELLQRLIQEEELPPLDELYALADLSLQEMEQLRHQWELVPVQMRRDVVSELVAAADEDLFLALG